MFLTMAGQGDKALGDVLRMHRKRRGESPGRGRLQGRSDGRDRQPYRAWDRSTRMGDGARDRAALEVRLGDLGNEIEAVEGS